MRLIADSVRGTLAALEAELAGAGFARRCEALETLELHVLDRLGYLAERAPLPEELEALRARAESLRRRLEAANARLLERLRQRIRSGSFTPGGLRRALEHHSGRLDGSRHYGTIDLLVAGLLEAGAPGSERLVREPEMVFYQPTPAAQILTLMTRAELTPRDVFYDLGSGLGQVVILVGLLTRARARGIEFEPSYCEYAERSARALNAPDIGFLNGDARTAPLSDGTVFFMYTPFRGAMLRQVLERLRTLAAIRPIRVCTLGSCTAEVAAAPWLEPASGTTVGDDEITVFRGRPGVPSGVEARGRGVGRPGAGSGEREAPRTWDRGS